MSTLNADSEYLNACPLDELRQKGQVVVHGLDRPVVLFFNDGDVRAVDNRCPHLGFPLHRGTIKDGMITCHWHHARFDACSGCTFDLWADDVPAYEVRIRQGQVFVSATPRSIDPLKHGFQRLRDGMEHNIGLIIAKAILTLRGAGVETAQIVREAALFGARHRDGWSMGLTILTAMANLLPHLKEQTAYLALYQGIRRTATDCVGQVPHRRRLPLASDELDPDKLDRWMHYWTMVRHRDGAERTLLSAIENPVIQPQASAFVLGSAVDRFYADGGHLLDFCNKVDELLDLIGHEHGGTMLPTLAGQLVGARGGEESNAWRHPIDLVPLVNSLSTRLGQFIDEGSDRSWSDEAGLADAMLGDDPQSILDAIAHAIQAGAKPPQLAKALAYASAMRVAWFGTANEISDWVAALHSFSYCHALHQAIKRRPSPFLFRGVLHGAMSVYLNRFLNVPKAKLPGPRGPVADLPSDGAALLADFLEALNRQQQVERCADIVAHYIDLGHPIDELFETFVLAGVREDADFHTLQMVEAGIRQYHEWGPGPQATHILIAIARYLAAHCPTPRAQLQTARIALRLHRGERIYEEEGSDG